MLPVAPFGPDAAFIPGRRAPVAFAARDIEPWSAKKLNRVAIISMKITVLFPELPFRAEWIFPRTADAIPRAGYVDSLITRPLVEELTSAAPWDTLVTTPVDPVSFRGDVRGRLGVFVRAFRDFAPSTGLLYGRALTGSPSLGINCRVRPGCPTSTSSVVTGVVMRAELGRESL
ncbi:hypothetical protein GN958_ATG21771 [Phytophthora infestans]|uniref:Uncharacterized protein n=1 Tax=Phytophthora infestans TaxID=4787 RepID=A0A8S9TQL2_PHYIN|nr:hypothetical protein GN958_ATG21771 [Phytophthora infestans]